MKNTMKKILVTALAASMALSMTACGGGDEPAGGNSGGGDAPAEEQSFKIRIACNGTAADIQGEGVSPAGKGMIYFCKEIEERSGGRITTQVFTDGQLASSTQEYIGNAQAGAYEMFQLNCGAWADYTPAYAGLNIPYLYSSFEDGYAVLDSDIRKGWDAMCQEATQCIPLAHLDIGMRQLTANKEIRTPADLKGIKIRTIVDPIQMECWTNLGASVTPVPYSELYTALQQGLVDAQENPPSNIFSSKMYEIQDYLMLTNHNFTTTIMAAAPGFWNGLSESDQKLIADTWHDTELYVREKSAEVTEDFYTQLEEKGMTIVELNADELKQFQDLAKTTWPMIEEQMGSEKFNELVDFVTEYQASK